MATIHYCAGGDHVQQVQPVLQGQISVETYHWAAYVIPAQNDGLCTGPAHPLSNGVHPQYVLRLCHHAIALPAAKDGFQCQQNHP